MVFFHRPFQEKRSKSRPETRRIPILGSAINQSAPEEGAPGPEGSVQGRVARGRGPEKGSSPAQAAVVKRAKSPAFQKLLWEKNKVRAIRTPFDLRLLAGGLG